MSINIIYHCPEKENSQLSEQ